MKTYHEILRLEGLSLSVQRIMGDGKGGAASLHCGLLGYSASEMGR